ncbi:MAG TPA: hypothetical protein VH020_03625, partial [Stellaceae bacterium]|nr:hypothetical protein [Stellaceae bacterium]
RRWVSYHGVSINLDPDLDHYRGIVPCGIAEHGVTSLRAEGVGADMASLDAALAETFLEVFGVDGASLDCSRRTSSGAPRSG